MNLLLDTCTFPWIAEDHPKLSAATRKAFTSGDAEVYLSTASAWEIATKHALGRLELAMPPDRYVPEMRSRHRIAPLPAGEEEALLTGRLEPHHRDPIDRLLVAQAILHGLTILTPDPAIAQYPIRTLW